MPERNASILVISAHLFINYFWLGEQNKYNQHAEDEEEGDDLLYISVMLPLFIIILPK